MRILFLGDVCGRSGRDAVIENLPGLRQRWKLDCVIVNGENSAAGFGITEAICASLIDAGADAVTLGNHAFDQREALVFINREPRLVRPVNYPEGTPGRGAALITLPDGRRVLVINAMGRVFIDAMDDPFRRVAREVEQCPLVSGCDAIVVDFHAEATSEKQALGHFLDGRVSLVAGTHTHVPTADYKILGQGTGYISDIGMCGCYDSVLGMDKQEPVRRFLEKTPGARMTPAEGPGALSGVAVETDDRTGLALKIAAFRSGPGLPRAAPEFWE